MNSRLTSTRTICTKCGKRVRDFKTRKDWHSRDMHLKCWQEEQDRIEFLRQYDEWKKRQEETEEIMKRYSY